MADLILLVEDDRAIRELAGLILRLAGYAVLDAHDGREGLRVYTTSPEVIDLIVSDVLMPGMDGGQMVRAILQDRPHQKVLFTSGSCEPATLPLRPGQVELMAKPYTPQGLCARVEALLRPAVPDLPG